MPSLAELLKMTPRLPAPDLANDFAGNAEARAHLFLRYDSVEHPNFANVGIGQFCHGISDALLPRSDRWRHWTDSKTKRMLHVLRTRHPLQVVQRVVHLVSVAVVDFVLWRWWRRQEGFSQQSMYGSGPSNTVATQSDKAIAILTSTRDQRPYRADASYPPIGVDFVGRFAAAYGGPIKHMPSLG